MPSKEVRYPRAKFPRQVIEGCLRHFNGGELPTVSNLQVRVSQTESWTLDTLDDFFAEYAKKILTASFYVHGETAKFSFRYYGYSDMFATDVQIELPSRGEIEASFAVLAPYVDSATAPEPPPKPPTVFIGHGHSSQWRTLADHLRDHHNLKIEAFETLPRAGFHIQEILDSMIKNSSIALLVHTPEDEDAEGGLHARENVVHETGLFQAALGWRRAIIIRQVGASTFSNVDGVIELRYNTTIAEQFGEVLATIRREFPHALASL